MISVSHHREHLSAFTVVKDSWWLHELCSADLTMDGIKLNVLCDGLSKKSLFKASKKKIPGGLKIWKGAERWDPLWTHVKHAQTLEHFFRPNECSVETQKTHTQQTKETKRSRCTTRPPKTGTADLYSSVTSPRSLRYHVFTNTTCGCQQFANEGCQWLW